MKHIRLTRLESLCVMNQVVYQNWKPCKTQQLEKLKADMEETSTKAQEWKEYSNMQRFKAEVLVDM
eukprot:scaffold670865_cov64-Prasinocladus_malaysianus.AAC.1